MNDPVIKLKPANSLSNKAAEALKLTFGCLSVLILSCLVLAIPCAAVFGFFLIEAKAVKLGLQ